MPTITHDLRSVVAELNTKINQLTSAKSTVMEHLVQQIAEGRDTATNRVALEDICHSLEAAKNGKTLLEDSCCNGQNCNIEYD